MLDFSNLSTWFALAILVVVIVQLIIIVYQHRTHLNQFGEVIQAVIGLLDRLQDSPQAMDLLESLATKVVPVELVKEIDKGADLLKDLTPDQLDELISRIQKFFDDVTDGQPNTKPAPPPPSENPPSVS